MQTFPLEHSAGEVSSLGSGQCSDSTHCPLALQDVWSLCSTAGGVWGSAGARGAGQGWGHWHWAGLGALALALLHSLTFQPWLSNMKYWNGQKII